MHTIWTICKQEVSTFFDSLMAYIIIIVFLGLSGFFTWLSGADIFFMGQASLSGFFNISFWTLFFFIPAITMRTLAEEQKTGTIELLATKPISDVQIVTGKWLACLILIVFSLVPTLMYYITVANIGSVDHGSVLGGYLAIILISGVYVSMGVFASSLTSNQIVAFILTLFIAFFFQLLFGELSMRLPGVIGVIANHLNLGTHFQTMSRGIVSLETVVYLLSMTALGLLLATVSIRRRTW